MTVFVVTWGESNLASVDDQGDILGASRGTKAALRKKLRADVVFWTTGDGKRLLRPGEDGHVRAVLESLDQAVVTK